ncbi:hydantoinase/oxoprolinase family protein [Ancylobacter terrae]|uniref:hydantoinase/oxoprolinase family protein n=1 Tax=Ancylobacter sp. sgz301288 TaxID=3342077 RepID=UPI003859DBA2
MSAVQNNLTLDIGIDVGGTFTDVVLLGSDGRIEVTKGLSTTHDQSVGAADAAGGLSLPLAGVRSIVHGTTVATNAILERRGARLALLTTAGFRDVLELQRQERRNIWDLYIRKVEPLVPRHLRFEVRERVAANGAIVDPLDDAGLEAVIAALRAAGVEAVAVSFLNAYANPAHEIAAAHRLREALGVYVVRSSAIAPHFREYERTSTTAISGYVGPKVSGYLDRFGARFGERGFDGGISVMGSNGGVLPLEIAGAHAATTCLSGPAGGVLATQRLSREKGMPDLISFDMGGTSTDVCLVSGGEAVVSTQFQIDGLPITLPMFAIETVSAGGGSIAVLDAGGMLRVGPESAGSTPGPACYGRGGTQPTVTDALCVLGLLRSEFFLGGRMKLVPEAAETAFAPIATALGEPVERVAAMVLHLANVKMANAVRLVSVRDGHDPRDFALVAFGGAGPLHACAVAEEIGVRRVVVPRFPGAFSAFGLLSANLKRDFVRSWPIRLSALDEARLRDELTAFRAGVEAEMAAIAKGRPVEWSFRADLRYVGQASELIVPIEHLTAPTIHGLAERFHAVHRAKFGYDERDADVEMMNLRLSGSVAVATPPLPDFPARSGAPVPLGRLPSRLEGAPLLAFAQRDELMAGDAIAGPAVIAEPTATTFVPRGWSMTVDPQGHLDLSRDAN